MRRSVGYRHIWFLSDPNAEVIGRYALAYRRSPTYADRSDPGRSDLC